jgi:hypothetical protein
LDNTGPAMIEKSARRLDLRHLSKVEKIVRDTVVFSNNEELSSGQTIVQFPKGTLAHFKMIFDRLLLPRVRIIDMSEYDT